MGTHKPNIELDFTPTYGSRDTTHVQPQYWRDPYTANMPIQDIARISKNYKTNQDEN